MKFSKHRRFCIQSQGGLGNQLFQFALAVTESLKNDCPFQILQLPRNATDTYSLEYFGIYQNKAYQAELDSQNFLTIKESKSLPTLFRTHFHEEHFKFKSIPSFENRVIVHGYFQSYRYFEEFAKPLKLWLRSKLFVEGNFRETIHVRIGDLYSNPEMMKFHGRLNEAYFLKNVREFKFTDKTQIVSDDYRNLTNLYPQLKKYVNSSFRKNLPFEDLRIIAESKKVIISNSTFGWWGAYLSDGLVVCPSDWFAQGNPLNNELSDLFPKSWNVR